MPVVAVNIARLSYKGSYAGPLTRAICSSLFIFPGPSIREFVPLKRFSLHRDTIARHAWGHISSVPYDYRVDKMFVQMIDVFDPPPVERTAHCDIVEDRKMLDILAKADAAGMRTNGHAKFRSHQQDRDHFVHTGETTAVDLTEIDSTGLQQLL